MVAQRVLLVDDIAMNRDVISAFLAAGGHEVTLAENGQDAIRLASQQNFDLILMDIRMPEMDGMEATRQIRALPGPHGQIPVLALTACFLPDLVARCQEAGMDGHVVKPVEYAALMRAVADAATHHKSGWIACTTMPAQPNSAGQHPSTEATRPRPH